MWNSDADQRFPVKFSIQIEMCYKCIIHIGFKRFNKKKNNIKHLINNLYSDLTLKYFVYNELKYIIKIYSCCFILPLLRLIKKLKLLI